MTTPRAGAPRAAVPRTVALLLLLVCLAACGGGGGGGGGGLQPTFFYVVASPAPDSFVADLSQIVTVQFNKAIDAESVTATSLTVTSAIAGVITGTTVLVDDDDGRTLRWTPTDFLASNAAHSCRIHPALRSEDDEAVNGVTFFNFRTTEVGPPIEVPTPQQLRRVTDTMVWGRQEHEATLLLDGRVLVTGGFTQGFSITDSAEVFSETTEQFSGLADTMSVERAGHTATRLSDGRVLIAGGWWEPSIGQLATSYTAELFLPQSNTFVSVGDMTTERTDHAAVLLADGRVLITGGSRLDGTFLTDLDSAEVFDPVSLTFSALASPLVHTRAAHGMVDMGNGKVALAGGSDVDLRVEWFDVATEAFVDLGRAASDRVRFGPAMASFESGAVLVAGGDDAGTNLHIEPLTGVVLNTGSGLDWPRAYATATRIAPGRIFVVGGVDFSQDNYVRASCDLVVEGGLGGSRTYSTQVFFPHGMAHHTATILASGDVLYCGGLNENGFEPNRAVGFIFTVTTPP